MWLNFTNSIKSAFAFLSSSKIPPGTPIEFREAMKKENHFASKKFFIAVTAFVGLCFFYFTSVGVLFILPTQNDIISGYVTIFTKTIEVLAIIIAAYLGVQAAVDLRYASTSNTSNETIKSIESIDEKIIVEETIKYAEIYKNDPSYAPIDWAMSYE